MKRVAVFDDPESMYHAIYGFITGATAYISIPVAAILTSIYLGYQVMSHFFKEDQEDYDASMFGDILEFALGFSAGGITAGLAILIAQKAAEVV